MMTDILALALKEICEENGLERLDIGYQIGKIFVTIWTPEMKVFSGYSANFSCDEAIEDGLTQLKEYRNAMGNPTES